MDGARFLADRQARVDEPVVAGDHHAAAADGDPDFDHAILRRVFAGGLDVDQRDRNVGPRMIGGELRRDAANDGPEEMSDSRKVAASRKTATCLGDPAAHFGEPAALVAEADEAAALGAALTALALGVAARAEPDVLGLGLGKGPLDGDGDGDVVFALSAMN